MCGIKLQTPFVPAAGCHIPLKSPTKTSPKSHLKASAWGSLPNTNTHVGPAGPSGLSFRGKIIMWICLTLEWFPLMFPHSTDLFATSSALMHIRSDSRPPVKPPCPLFPCSSPSELAAFTQSHALSWDELQQHGGQADLMQGVQSVCIVKSIPITPLCSFMSVIVLMK